MYQRARRFLQLVKQHRLLIFLAGVLLSGTGLLYLVGFSGVNAWNPIDYDNFREYGANFLQGRRTGYLYPLPTVLWVFVPLSLAPEWFVVIWILGPFLFCLNLFRKSGVVLWLATPVLMHAALGQMDGWFLLPLYWLTTERQNFGAPSAALLTLKPQLGIAIVPFMCFKWLREKKYQELLLFSGTLLLLFVPAFVIDPDWLLDFLPMALWRGQQPLLLSRGASLWAWWWRADGARLLLPVILIAVVALSLRAYRQHPVKAVFVVGLLFTPVFFPLSYITVIAILPAALATALVFTVTSWLALSVDFTLNGWGGIYVILPLIGLWLLGIRQERNEQGEESTLQALLRSWFEEARREWNL